VVWFDGNSRFVMKGGSIKHHPAITPANNNIFALYVNAAGGEVADVSLVDVDILGQLKLNAAVGNITIKGAYRIAT